jgi:glutathione S-transferase
LTDPHVWLSTEIKRKRPELQMTITVYGAALSPFVRKVRVVLAEKGIEYKHDPVSPFAPPDYFLAISPLKRIPVLRDESEGPDATLADSSAICGYLEKKFPATPLYPAKPFDYGRTLWIEEYADSDFVGTIGGGVFRAVVVAKLMRKEPDLALAKDTWETKAPRFFDYFEKELGNRTNFVGNALTLADIAVASPFVNAAHAGFAPDASKYPNLVRFLKAIHARSSFAASIAEERKMLTPLGIPYAA